MPRHPKIKDKLTSEALISKGDQTVVPAKIRNAHKIMPEDVLEWIDRVH